MKKSKIRVGPELNDGRHLALRRDENGDEAVGVIAHMKDGQPLPAGAELLSVDSECQEGWHDTEVIYQNGASADDEGEGGDSREVAAGRSSGGPAQVATPAYREGYDRIFGKKPTVGVA